MTRYSCHAQSAAVSRGTPYDATLSRSAQFAMRKTRLSVRYSRLRRRYTSPYRDVIRDCIAAARLDNDAIAARLVTPRQIVSKRRERFVRERLRGLEERSRSRRPALFPPGLVVAVKALACQLPYESVGETTLWRWLSEDAIRPWSHRTWIFPRDRLSSAKPPECSICTRGNGRGNASANPIASSPRTRRSVSRRVAASMPACLPQLGARLILLITAYRKTGTEAERPEVARTQSARPVLEVIRHAVPSARRLKYGTISRPIGKKRNAGALEPSYSIITTLTRPIQNIASARAS